MNRRNFVKTSLYAGSLLGFPYVSSLSAKPGKSDRLNVAYVGVGGHGVHASQGNRTENTVGYCDVDERRAAETYSMFPDVPRFRDFRVMFDKLGNGIDAVGISTPDHTHFPIAMEAMQRGYHIYLEKPMAHTIEQIRILRAAAKKYGVTTQLGVHGHSFAGLRVLKEWLDAEVVGEVTDIHLWTNRPRESDFHTYEQDAPEEPIPDGVSWDLWLGPARYRPFNNIYLPKSWRGWWDFGNGPLGDIGAHMWDVLEFCFELGAPKTVSGINPRMSDVGTPRWCKVDYEYAAKAGRGPVKVRWYSGEKDGQPHLPENLPHWPEGDPLKESAGMYFVGTEGALYFPDMRAKSAPIVLPQERWKDFRRNLPPKTLPRIKGSHYSEFFSAIREGRRANADFEYGATLNEGVLVGNLALKTGKTIHWDSENMKAIGVPEADQYIRSPEPREGWKYTL
ncbi:Gfo/Idh/MocA family oxidoreductase [Pelagicoccus sp. NFK12]|uniref:Gfo/Idh/MocA family oxidoreductase n=1 Tax=Pelagicoccus enzymogenes TaxID=2773457 RepID=A0A927F902_9BACT|nr:Gfo/Idh/MocA family oxidoreductase [Pelagicoccus enzymogenes]MBD5779133.1 Gfo/Idh/MocA family oxidoreductase [Pelagicoccus enzymogenes]